MRHCVFCLAILLVPTNGWASAFTILDVQNHIAGRAGDSVNGFRDFDLTSPNALSFGIDTDPGNPDRHSMVAASADGTTVFVTDNEGRDDLSGGGIAISTVDFQSNFSGVFDGLEVAGASPEEGSGLIDSSILAFWAVTDLTSGVTLISTHQDFRGQSIFTNLEVDWNENDVYQLMFGVNSGANNQPDSGFLTTNLKTVNTPEPSTLWLMSLAILAIVFGSTAFSSRTRARPSIRPLATPEAREFQITEN